MNRVYLLLGGNAGNVSQTIGSAIISIEKNIGKVIHLSSLYLSQAWGYESQPDFINQAILVQTDFSPDELLNELLKIENEYGRFRTGEKWRERNIDIDILFFQEYKLGDWSHVVLNNPHLIIPHPYLHLRRFALVPLTEMDSSLVHPILNKNISELVEQCPDKLMVNKIS